MRTSESIGAISKALLAAQRQVKDAAKSGVNPHFKSKYAPIEEVIGVCKAALNANGIAFVQGGEESAAGTVALSTRLIHESGEWIESTLTMTPAKNDPQGVGACITYARRYGLAAICGVANEDDDDGNTASNLPAQPQPSKWSTTQSGRELLEEYKQLVTQYKVSEDRAGKGYEALLTKPTIQAARDYYAKVQETLEAEYQKGQEK